MLGQRKLKHPGPGPRKHPGPIVVDSRLLPDRGSSIDPFAMFVSSQRASAFWLEGGAPFRDDAHARKVSGFPVSSLSKGSFMDYCPF